VSICLTLSLEEFDGHVSVLLFGEPCNASRSANDSAIHDEIERTNMPQSSIYQSAAAPSSSATGGGVGANSNVAEAPNKKFPPQSGPASG
jgi:hypothetical protein